MSARSRSAAWFHAGKSIHDRVQELLACPRVPSEHELKCWPEPFSAVVERRKTYEIRRDDRGGFRVGDLIVLREWDPNWHFDRPFSIDARIFRALNFSLELQALAAVVDLRREVGRYTGREFRGVVTYVTPAGAWGLPADLCVFGIVPAPQMVEWRDT